MEINIAEQIAKIMAMLDDSSFVQPEMMNNLKHQMYEQAVWALVSGKPQKITIEIVPGKDGLIDGAMVTLGEAMTYEPADVWEACMTMLVKLQLDRQQRVNRPKISFMQPSDDMLDALRSALRSSGIDVDC